MSRIVSIFLIIGYGLAGVVLLVGGIQDTADALYAWWTMPADVMTMNYMWTMKADGMRAVTGLAAGVVLFIGREVLATAWWRTRTPRLNVTRDDQDPGDR